MLDGTVKTWKDGVGVITDDDGCEDCIVHQSVLKGCDYLSMGEKVHYNARWDDRATNLATEVSLHWKAVEHRELVADKVLEVHLEALARQDRVDIAEAVAKSREELWEQEMSMYRANMADQKARAHAQRVSAGFEARRTGNAFYSLFD
jgi:cold shock CspA family protein